MKRIALLMLGLPFFAIGQQGKFTVSGRIGNYNEPSMIFLLKFDSPYTLPYTILDSAILKNGQFHFEGTTGILPVHAAVSVQERRPGSNPKRWDMFDDEFEFYLEPGDIGIHAGDSAKHASIEGSSASADYRLYITRKNASEVITNAKREQLRKKWDSIPREVRQTPEYTDSYLAESSAIRREEEQPMLDFIREKPGSLINLDLLQVYASGWYTPEKVGTLFNSFDPALKASPKGKLIAGKIAGQEKLGTGMEAPGFTLTDTSGQPVSVGSFRGKYLLVEFWASWCGGCRFQNPHLVRAYRKFHDKNFEILSVSLDTEKYAQAWKKAIVQDGLTWYHVADLAQADGWKNEAVLLYQVEFVPQNFLLDPEGKIIARNLRGTQLEKILAEKL